MTGALNKGDRLRGQLHDVRVLMESALGRTPLDMRELLVLKHKSMDLRRQLAELERPPRHRPVHFVIRTDTDPKSPERIIQP